MAFDPLRNESITKESDLDHENESNVKCNKLSAKSNVIKTE